MSKIINKRARMTAKSMQGLSLIELLIAMVLGLTLAAGVIQIYVGSSATETTQIACHAQLIGKKIKRKPAIFLHP